MIFSLTSSTVSFQGEHSEYVCNINVTLDYIISFDSFWKSPIFGAEISTIKYFDYHLYTLKKLFASQTFPGICNFTACK